MAYMGSVIGCGLPGDLITIKYKVAALFFFLSCFWPLEVCMCCGGVALAVGGVSRRVSAFKGDNSCWGAVALSAGLSCGGWGERGLVGCVQS